MSDIKLHCYLGRNDLFYYPDLMVCCDPEETATHYREHPCLVVAVLSEGTRSIDLREKLMAYTRIESLHAYMEEKGQFSACGIYHEIETKGSRVTGCYDRRTDP